MALNTFVPPLPPSPGTGRKPALKILAADFGDGYSQPVPDGLNSIRMTVTLTWAVLTEAQMQQIETFFFEHKGTIPFYYKPAGHSGMGKWTCKEWNSSLDEGVWKTSATFVEDFTLQT
mgnify:CR=1 FL=1